MIYGHIEEWILRENPAFARAVAEHYSILRGDTNAAAFGEVAYWQMGEQLLSRMPADPAEWSEEERSIFLPLQAHVENQRRRAGLQAGETVRTSNAKYFRKLFACLKLLEKRKQRGEEDPYADAEYIFQAYRFLRVRDGQGSLLPLKQEVKELTSLIKAFHIAGLMEKLPRHLPRNPKQRSEMERRVAPVTDKQMEHILEKQQQFLDSINWIRGFEATGLKDLHQARCEK
jgi:tRNA nucleotidyltransferase/poly(A) polymerase